MLAETRGDAHRRWDALSYLLVVARNELDVVRESLAHQDDARQRESEREKFENTEFACPSCGQRKCKTWEKQTRSQDEAATLFAKCVCGKIWKPPQ